MSDNDVNQLNDDWKSVLSTLSEREAQVIVYRFGLLGNDPSTLEQVGGVFGVTRERIRQIEAKAIRKMRARAHIIGLELADYFEN